MLTEGQYCSAKDVILDECAVRHIRPRKKIFAKWKTDTELLRGVRTQL
jgi:hypothetical protein